MFIDEATIYVQSGAGGSGCIAFRREKYVPRGGPSGGDGGRGGDVVIVAQGGVKTLIDLQFHPHYKAGRGQHGQGALKKGMEGKDCVIPVPPGTVVYDAESGELLADLVHVDDRVLVAQGGRGGRGNPRFTSPSRQAPRFAEKGEPGGERRLRLVLKLLADVGVVGFPNVGKSTFISRISAARPKIADYPFTTLVPNLGTVKIDDFSFVVADMPGLIEGAHAGAGLGHTFLKHIERTRLLVHILDMAGVEGRDPLRDFDAINQELRLFNKELAGRPHVVAANKMDLPDAQARLPRCRAELRRRGVQVFPISAVTGEGVQPLLHHVAGRLRELERQAPTVAAAAKPQTLVRVKPEAPLTLSKNPAAEWVLTGGRIERTVGMIDFDNDEAVAHLERQLKRSGVYQFLRSQGVREGETVWMGDVAFTFTEMG